MELILERLTTEAANVFFTVPKCRRKPSYAVMCLSLWSLWNLVHCCTSQTEIEGTFS
jgi:hypothetical protein